MWSADTKHIDIGRGRVNTGPERTVRKFKGGGADRRCKPAASAWHRVESPGRRNNGRAEKEDLWTHTPPCNCILSTNSCSVRTGLETFNLPSVTVSHHALSCGGGVFLGGAVASVFLLPSLVLPSLPVRFVPVPLRSGYLAGPCTLQAARKIYLQSNFLPHWSRVYKDL